jgi:hypothetical protein
MGFIRLNVTSAKQLSPRRGDRGNGCPSTRSQILTRDSDLYHRIETRNEYNFYRAGSEKTLSP